MYNLFKPIIKSIISKKQLFKIEPAVRSIYSIIYRGNKYQCNVCNTKLRKFVSSYDHKICPNCGSFERSRKLYEILLSEFIVEGIRILDFSPTRSQYRNLKNREGIHYVSTDYEGEFLADKQLNITNIEENDNSYDLIICYHVLEHIEDDLTAIKELHRVLDSEGTCIIQTPFKEGYTFEDKSITTPEARKAAYGQADHVRIYSSQDLAEKLTSVGFLVDARNYKEEKDNYYGFKENQTVLVCKKK